MKRRLISFIIILALFLNLCPAWALAAEPQGLDYEDITTLVADRTISNTRQVSTPQTIRTGRYTWICTRSTAMQVTGTGALTLSGTVISNAGAGVEVQSGGRLYLQEPISITGTTYALDIAEGKAVQLVPGTYSGTRGAIRVADGDYAALLGEGFAFFDGGNVISPNDLASAKTVTVGQCTEHTSRIYDHDAGTATHTWTCTACKTAKTELCTFDFNGNAPAHCRQQCGHSIDITVDESALGDLVYNGADQSANVTLAVRLEDGTELKKDVDYTVNYSTRADVGDITVTVTGLTFHGTFVKTYHVEQDKPGIRWNSTGYTVDYDGSAVTADELLPHITIATKSNEDLYPFLKYAYTQNGADFTDGLPTHAGTYRVKAYLEESQNYKAAETDPLLTLTINKIDPITQPPGATKPTYNRAAQELVTAGTLDPAALADGLAIEFATEENGAYSATIPTGTNAYDSYSVWYKVVVPAGMDRNYNIPNPNPAPAAGVAIQRKSITPAVTLSQYSYLYDGGYKEPTVTVKDSDGVTGLPDTEYKVEYQNNRDVGTAKVVVSDSDPNGGNYHIERPVEVEFSITSKTQDALSITNQPSTFTYGDKFTLGASGGSGHGNVTWEIVSGPAQVGQSSGQVVITGCGDITVKATKSGKDPVTNAVNYDDATATWTFTAVQKPVTATVTAEDKVYDGDDTATIHVTWRDGDLINGDRIDLEPVLTGKFDSFDAGTGKQVTIILKGGLPDGDGKYVVTYNTTTTASILKDVATAPALNANNRVYDGTTKDLVTGGSTGTTLYSGSRDGVYSDAVPQGANAGTYTVWYKTRGDANHNDSEPKFIPVIISRRTLSLTDPKVTVELSGSDLKTDTDGTYYYEYDGTEKTPTVVIKYDSEVIPAVEYRVSYSSNKNAGGATVTITDNAGGNYEISATGTVSFEIRSIAAVLTGKPQDRNLTYNGAAQQLVTVGTATGGHIEYRLHSNAGPQPDYSTNIPEGIDAGTYTVDYMVVGDGIYSNGPSGSVTVTIQPKEAAPTILLNGQYAFSTAYTGGEITPPVTVNVGGEPTSSFTPTYSNNTRVGTATVTVQSTGGNYKFFGVTTFEITKAEATFHQQPAAKTLEYSGGPQELVDSGSAAQSGLLVVYSTDGSTYLPVIPAATDRGSYLVIAKVQGNEMYEDSDPVILRSIIDRNQVQSPTVTLSASSMNYTGSELKPAVTVIDKGATIPASEYTVSYSGNVNVGTATVTVTGSQNNYTGFTATAEFQIVDASQPVPAITPPPAGDSAGGSGTPPVDTVSDLTQTTVRNGTANTVLSAAGGSRLVREAVANQSRNIVIQPEITGSVTRAAVSIPASTVSQINSQTDAALTVASPIAGVTIPNGALDALGGAGGTVNVVTERVDGAVALTLTAGGKAVDSVPGGVTLTVPAEGASPGTVAVLVNEDGTRETIQKSVVKDGAVCIPLDGSATVEIVDNSKNFDDVSPTDWEADAVAFASAHELFGGTSDTTFSPEQEMSRGMLATVLYRLEGLPDQDTAVLFEDVDSGAWYTDGVAWAAENGIVNGDGQGQFRPNDSITREQFAVMLWRYAGSPEAGGDEGLAFTDADQASGYAQQALLWAVANGVISGYPNGRLNPGGTATRAQAAQMLKNFMENT